MGCSHCHSTTGEELTLSDQTTSQTQNQYICPMCPGVYSKIPSTCPKCGMALEVSHPLPRSYGVWTCPMHPEVKQDKPGDCPKCGMALEPISVEAQEEHNPEWMSMRRRFWVSSLFTVPLLVVAMGDMVVPVLFHAWASQSVWRYVQLVLAFPVCTWAAWPFFERAFRSFKNRNLNMFSLIGVGVGVAFLYSLTALLFPDLLPESFKDHAGHAPVYFESASVIVTLVLLGQVLELSARRKTGHALQTLLSLAPEEAWLIDVQGRQSKVRLETIKVNDRLRVKPGERVPVDGVVISGSSYVDESMLSGEAQAVKKSEGDQIVAGTINQQGSFEMRAEKVGADTVLSRMVEMVGRAQRSRAPIQSLADKVAAYFVPAVFLVAVLSFGAWALWGPEPRLAYALLNAIAVLIIACPCALGLATPMSVVVAMGKAAQSGVLFRNAAAIETLQKIDTLVVDKTGTLTEGNIRVSAVIAADEHFGHDQLIRLAAAVEQHSEHPLARAITQHAQNKGIAVPSSDEFVSHAGKGVSGRVDGKDVLIGNKALFQEHGGELGQLAHQGEALVAQGHGVFFVGTRMNALGLIAVRDPIKENARQILDMLKQHGLHVVMLTGDQRGTAEAVAKELGIDHVFSDVLPEQKLQVIAQLQKERRVVAMAGDGINDAPALAQADIGIAMGDGTDVAMQSGEVILLKGDLSALWRALYMADKTMQNIRQNLFFAFVYNAAGVPVAAGVLYPFIGILLSPMVAAAAMSLSSVSVIANALRLRAVAFPKALSIH